MITSSTVTTAKENIAVRRTIVYETLIDPTVARVVGEKNKGKLFGRFMFGLKPEQIEFISMEKYYEPFLVISGKYLIDYYRRCSYVVNVGREVKEVVLLDHTFVPEKSTHSSNQTIEIHGEERIIKENNAFLVLNYYGEEMKLGKLPSAPSEKDPQEVMKAFKMQESTPIAPDMDVEIIRKKIARQPADVNRIVNEEFGIDERSVIYAPRYRLTYENSEKGQESCLVIDGVTSKPIRDDENMVSAFVNKLLSKIGRFFGFVAEKIKLLKK